MKINIYKFAGKHGFPVYLLDCQSDLAVGDIRVLGMHLDQINSLVLHPQAESLRDSLIEEIPSLCEKLGHVELEVNRGLHQAKEWKIQRNLAIYAQALQEFKATRSWRRQFGPQTHISK